MMAKPIGGEWLEDSIQGLKQLGIDGMVSLLEPQEQYTLGLTKQADYCQLQGINYLNFPIPDRGLPNTAKAITLAKQLYDEIKDGKHWIIHCRAGIGRTGIIAGAVLVTAGLSTELALQTISQARSVQVPDTDKQVAWLKQLPLHFKNKD